MRIPANILDVSARTTTKILKRLNVGCSRCGWNEAPCDIHHIVHQQDGGTNRHSNLTILCPNCHRLAHYGQIKHYVTIDEQVGNRWLEHFHSVKDGWRIAMAKSGGREKAIAITNQRRREADKPSIERRLEALRSSGIDFSRYGWVSKAAPIVEVRVQKVVPWIKRNDPELYARCYLRPTQLRRPDLQ